jgi:hypothetical protein
MILKWNEFKDDFIFESLINETYVYYINDFKDILKSLSKDNPIAKDLLDTEKKDIKSDITFISLSKRDGYVGGSTLRNLKSNLEKKYGEFLTQRNYDEEEIKKQIKKQMGELFNQIDSGEFGLADAYYNALDLGSRSRNDIKLGRLVNALLPGKYTSKDIEDFTNKFKAKIKKQEEVFEEVTGEDINYWYYADNYEVMSGSLGSSCMARKKGLFDIYVKNPDVCKLLILVKDDKLIGRALVWKLDTIKVNNKELETNWFMDRQYTINDSLVEKFRNYAEEKGWITKTRNSHSSFEEVTIGEDYFNAKMTVKVKVENYQKFPYMDTFKRFDPKEGILYNDEDEDNEEYEGHYILNETSGGWHEIGGVWSEWHDRRIPREGAVWSIWADSYIYADRAIYVESGSSRYRDEYYPEDCDDIVYNGWDDESIHIEDATYCDNYGYYILSDYAVEVIDNVEYDGEPTGWIENYYHEDDDNLVSSYKYNDENWYEILSNRWRGWRDCDYAHSSIFEKDYKGSFILKEFSMDVYPVKGDFSVKWLSEVDAEILGIELGDDYRVTDKFDYEFSLSSIRKSLEDKLRVEVNRIEDTLNDTGQLQFKFSEEETENYKSGIRFRLNRYKDRLAELKKVILLNK